MERPSDHAREVIKQLAQICRMVGARSEKVSYEPYQEMYQAAAGEPTAGRYTIQLSDAAHRYGVMAALGTVLTDGEGASLVDILKAPSLRGIVIDLVPQTMLEGGAIDPTVLTNQTFRQTLAHGIRAIAQQPDEFKVLPGRAF